MFFFKKKAPEEKAAQSGSDDDSEESEEKKPAVSGNIEVALTKITTQLEALNEVRKANAEQFTRVSEQIGELRSAIMDSNRAISTIEVASTKAIDLVNSVQPDKLMMEVRKEDGKIESLKANIEANETIIKDLMKALKEMREQMNFYKGVDQVIKMNNDIKQEMLDIKKTEGLIGRHADRVETIFVEVEKKFYDFEKFNEAVKELDRSFKKLSTDFDKMRVSVEEKSDKKELVKLIDKFTDFEKHTSNILKLLDQKSKTLVGEINSNFKSLKAQLEKNLADSSKKLEVKEIQAVTVSSTSSASASSAVPASGNDASQVAKDNPSVDKSANNKPAGAVSTETKSVEEEKKDWKNVTNGVFGFLRKK
jgi:prefoldin subunit 5